MLFPFRREFSEPPELADNLSQLGVGLGGGGIAEGFEEPLAGFAYPARYHNKYLTCQT